MTLPAAYYRLVIRLARLAELRAQAEEEEAWDALNQCKEKKKLLLRSLQKVVDAALGPAVCPLCQPERLRPPIRLQGLRSCTTHAASILETVGRSYSLSGATPNLLTSWLQPRPETPLMPEQLVLDARNLGASRRKSSGSKTSR